MGDLGGSHHQTQSLVSQFDQLLIKQEEARADARQTGPEYFLKVLEISALADARDTEKLREARDQILGLEREVERLQSQILSDDQMRSEVLEEAWQQILRLEQEIETLQSKEVRPEELSRAQQQKILQLEQEVLANQRKSEQLAETRQQNHLMEETVKKVELESQAKSKVIEDLQEELLLLRKQQEDLDNHNHVIWGTSSIMDLSKDISTLMEDCFQGGNTATKGKFLASTPATRILPREKLKRRSMSLDLQVIRTPIIPGLCKKCSSRPRDPQPGEDDLDSPILPWCPHGVLELSTAGPTLSSAQLLLRQPQRGARKTVAPKHLKKIM